MSDEYKTIDTSFLLSKLTAGNVDSNKSSVGNFDPYKLMLKRKQAQSCDVDDIPTKVIKYDDNDVEELKDFCQKYNIVGFNFGKMHPKSALNMLKNKLGILNEQTNKKILLG